MDSGDRGTYGVPAEVEGREGGRQGGRGPAPGSAWVKFRATQVLGGAAAGIFASVPPEYVHKDNSDQEKEAQDVESVARRFGELLWQEQGVPPPDFAVISDDLGTFRAELTVFVKKYNVLREVRKRGPPRKTAQEARKDGSEMRRTAFLTAAGDSGLLLELQARVRELAEVQWSAVDLAGEDAQESAERRLPEFTTATQAEKFKEQEKSVSSLREWIYAKKEEQSENFQPSGPSWSLAGQAMSVPRLAGVWYVHERQQEGGRPLPWLFFNASTGKYYRIAHGNAGSWVQTGTPHPSESHPISMVHAVLCQPSETGKKDDLAVALVDLPRTAQALKQPVPFIDKPASLFVLVDGLRSTTAAAEFCAKRFHSQILPRLSCRADPLEDHELLAIVNESLESLDHALLDSSARYGGCGFAVALLLGRRLVVGTLGDCRAVLCRPPAEQAKPPSQPPSWQARLLAAGEGSRTPAVAAAERRRLHDAYSPLDFEAARCLHAASASAEVLASQPSDAERAIFRVARAAHPFAALGLSVTAVQAGIPMVRQVLAECEEVIRSAQEKDSLRALAEAALVRVREAAAEVESIMSMDMYVTQLLAELYYLIDEENGIPSPKRAAALLGVEPGCGEAAAQAGIDRRYRALFTQLAAVSPQHAKRSFRILDELADAAARPATPVIWTPPGDRSASVTRALGFRDMKRQRPLIGLELSSEMLWLQDGSHFLTLLTDGARGISEARLGEIASCHRRRPKAACLRIASEASQSAPSEATGTIAVFFDVGEGEAGGSKGSAEAAKGGPPDAKKRKVENVTPGGKRKIRVASLLLKYAGVGESDSLARRKAPLGRTQADAEKELLAVLESLHAPPKAGEPKDLALRFAAKCAQLSDCKSATNKPHADLGWVFENHCGKEFDAVAFELGVGCLSDIFTTPRGAHILYRLA